MYTTTPFFSTCAEGEAAEAHHPGTAHYTGEDFPSDEYIAPIERSAKLRESSERRDYEHEKTMDRQGKARDSA